MNDIEKSNLLDFLIDEVMSGKAVYWSSREENRYIDYERAADELTADWCLFNELLRKGKHEAAGKLVADANADTLEWLISNALDDYGVAPDGYAEDEAA